MNGSRANPSAKRDIFQDYDIANFVTDVDPFRDYEFIRSHFGEAIMVQTPEDKERPPAAGDGRYNYNMQLVDGNRIDLSFFPLDKLQELVRDSPCDESVQMADALARAGVEHRLITVPDAGHGFDGFVGPGEQSLKEQAVVDKLDFLDEHL
jgi:hypothetical protein